MTEFTNKQQSRQSSRYPNLSQPGQIGKMQLKNRIIMGPMGTNYGTTDGFSTDRDKQYYAERAKGSVAMIITEAMNVSAGARNHNNSLCIFHDRFIPGLESIVKAIKDNGALAVAQLNHRGQLLRRSVLGMEPVGPSASRHPATGEHVRALDISEIRDIQKSFVDAAKRTWQAGYDACEIHAANGYLFQQFFSERFNKRTDQYGGSLKNRMRLLLETIQMISEAVPKLELLVRISASEFTTGGYTEQEAITLAGTLEQSGIVALDLSGGSNEHPCLSRYCIQPPSFPRGFLTPYAKPFTDALNIPVIMAGRIITPDDAEDVLKNKSADYVSLGRALIADPHWTSKALGEIDAPIRRCISCNICYERLSLEKDVSCVANPMVGTEFETLEHLEPQLFQENIDKDNLKKVLVIGAGVAGMEAGRMAAAKGHTVEIWEHSDKLGGQLPLAMASLEKKDVEGIWDYRIQAHKALGLTTKTGMEVTDQTINQFNPDLVIVATGAKPRPLPMDIQFDVPVYQAWDILLNPELIKPDTNLTLIGGGQVGIEVADLLVERGCRITIVELRHILAPEMARNNRFEIISRLEKYNTRILTGAQIVRKTDDKLVIDIDGDITQIEVGDAIIVAIGSIPNRDVLAEVNKTNFPHVLVGDCYKPGSFMTAIRDASMVGFAINQLVQN